MKRSLHEILKAKREVAASRPSPKTQWERILVPIDFTHASREALKLAVSLAADPKDRITLVHVVEEDSWLQGGNAVMMTLSRSEAEIQFEAERRLERWAAQEAGPDIRVETIVRMGKAHREILHVAESRHCDVIVLATQPKSWFRRLVRDCLSRQLQREARCAVISICPATVPGRSFIPIHFVEENPERIRRLDGRTSILAR